MYPDDGRESHTASRVYGEMVLQVCRHYSGLPDVRTLSLDDLVFFYDGIVGELIAITRPVQKR